MLDYIVLSFVGAFALGFFFSSHGIESSKERLVYILAWIGIGIYAIVRLMQDVL